MNSDNRQITIAICNFLVSILCKMGVIPIIEMTPYYWKYVALKGIDVLVISTFAWLVIVLIRYAKKVFIKRMELHEHNIQSKRQVITQYDLLEKVIVVSIVIASISSIFLLFDSVRKIGISLFASAGIAGLVIGLAAQKVIGTLFAGFQIAFTQPIRQNDAVVVENEWGTIEEINLTNVVIRLWDKRSLIVPSTYFLDHPFENWTKSSTEILATVNMYVDYSVEMNIVRNQFTRILSETILWDGQTYNIQVTELNESGMQIRMLASARNASEAWDLRVLLREKLIHFIQNEHPEWLPVKRQVLQSPAYA